MVTQYVMLKHIDGSTQSVFNLLLITNDLCKTRGECHLVEQLVVMRVVELSRQDHSLFESRADPFAPFLDNLDYDLEGLLSFFCGLAHKSSPLRRCGFRISHAIKHADSSRGYRRLAILGEKQVERLSGPGLRGPKLSLNAMRTANRDARND